MLGKKLSTLLLFSVIITLNLVIPRIGHICYCPDNPPEGYRCMCNCAKCVSNRGGFVCFYSHRETEEQKPGIHVLSSGCCWGGEEVDFEAPGSVFAIVPGSSFNPPLPVIHVIQTEGYAVPQEIHLSPREKPT